MALQDIIQKILDEADIEIRRIKLDLEAEQKLLIQESVVIEAREKNLLEEKKNVAIKTMGKRATDLAHREIQKKMLTTKRQILTKTLEKLLSHLENTSDEKYGEILKVLFSKISERSGKVFVSPKRQNITKKILPSGFEVLPDEKIGGGFILKFQNGLIDATFRTIIFSEFRDEFEIFLAERFGFTS